MPAPHKYLVIEYEPQKLFDNLDEPLKIATEAHGQNRSKGYAVVELVSVVSSRYETIVHHHRDAG